jgi:uncharacterized protein
MTHTALWRRLDVPGHDACRLKRTERGWKLEGTAVFQHEREPARVEYVVVCDRAWHSRFGRVKGFIGRRSWDLRIERSAAGHWTLNGTPVAAVEGCFDLDLGFTPATNALQLNRVCLDIGASAAFPVAWLDLPEPSLQLLPQRYERRSASSYWYESPTASYAAVLELTDSGFVRLYPQLWRMEE